MSRDSGFECCQLRLSNDPRMSSGMLAKGGSRLGYSNMSFLGPPGLAGPSDRTPHMPAAGLGYAAEASNETAEKTLKPDVYEKPPPTPEYMQKWRKDYAPGSTILHPGLADDTDHERVEVYGRPEPVGVKVHEVLNIMPKSHLIEKAIEKKEGIYLSHKREPLGKAYVRGHDIPDVMQTTGFGRPAPQDISGDASKQLLHPVEQLVDEAVHTQYVKSHSNFEPGEQRHRGYTWVDKKGEIDPKRFPFGADVKQREVDGVAKSLNTALNPDAAPEAIVVEKRLEDYRELRSEPLGAVKSVGHNQKTSPEFVFGLPSQRAPEWGVRECIGNYTPEEQQPDVDLGRSIRPGWRNTAPDERVFGTPSIRNDIEAPKLKSVADHQNYGDEANASQLLYPPRYADSGVTGGDFLEARSEQDLTDIFGSAGFGIEVDEIAATYAKAAQLDPNGLVSIESFRRMLNAATAAS